MHAGIYVGFSIPFRLILLFVIQGIEQIKNEVEDPGEALIDGVHGHGR